MQAISAKQTAHKHARIKRASKVTEPFPKAFTEVNTEKNTPPPFFPREDQAAESRRVVVCTHQPSVTSTSCFEIVPVSASNMNFLSVDDASTVFASWSDPASSTRTFRNEASCPSLLTKTCTGKTTSSDWRAYLRRTALRSRQT